MVRLSPPFYEQEKVYPCLELTKLSTQPQLEKLSYLVFSPRQRQFEFSRGFSTHGTGRKGFHVASATVEFRRR